MIAIDGITDEEKLAELLAFGCECTELEFKEAINFNDGKERLGLVVDIVAMANHYPGGFIVIGVCDNGSPSAHSRESDWNRFDTAHLNDLINKYVDAPIRMVSQHQIMDGHEYQVICVLSPDDGLPIPFSKDGTYDSGNGNQKTVFRKGVFIRRENAQNTPISYSQWDEVLKVHDEAVRAQERHLIDELVRNINGALSERECPPLLEPDFSGDVAMSALEDCFERGRLEGIRRYLVQLRNLARNDATYVQRIATVACFAALYDEEALFLEAADAFHKLATGCTGESSSDLELQLELAVNGYIIGASAVRSSMWSVISPLVNKTVIRGGYVWASWLRECQVNNSRARNIDSDPSGTLISLSLERMRQDQTLHPDVVGSWDEESGQEIRDLLLSSLCSFDYLYCVCVYAEGEGMGEAYPGCVVYRSRRIQEVIDLLVSPDEGMRRSLLKKADDSRLAAALSILTKLIRDEAMSHGYILYDCDPTGSIDRFIELNDS